MDLEEWVMSLPACCEITYVRHRVRAPMLTGPMDRWIPHKGDGYTSDFVEPTEIIEPEGK